MWSQLYIDCNAGTVAKAPMPEAAPGLYTSGRSGCTDAAADRSDP